MIELYAITDHPGPALPQAPALRLVSRGSLAGVCATTTGDVAVTPEALWRHEQIVEELMEDRDVLPVRYGTRFADEAAAGRALEERREQLAAALERVRGAVELAVRVIARPPEAAPVTVAPARRDASPSAVTGTEYLRSRMRDHASQSEAVRLVHEPLSELARDVALRPPVLPDERMRAAYLVRTAAVDAFSGLVRRLQDANPQLLITCTGPWPAYTFAQT